MSTATRDNGQITLNARKSWVTSALRATAYVWSSQPVTPGAGLSTLWLVPSETSGIQVQGAFDGLGLRGNDSSPVSADGVRVAESAMLGEDGKGFDIMMSGASNDDALRLGSRRVRQLIHDMDEGRRKRLVRLGFPDDEAAALSAHHTRNFM